MNGTLPLTGPLECPVQNQSSHSTHVLWSTYRENYPKPQPFQIGNVVRQGDNSVLCIVIYNKIKQNLLDRGYPTWHYKVNVNDPK